MAIFIEIIIASFHNIQKAIDAWSNARYVVDGHVKFVIFRVGTAFASNWTTISSIWV